MQELQVHFYYRITFMGVKRTHLKVMIVNEEVVDEIVGEEAVGEEAVDEIVLGEIASEGA